MKTETEEAVTQQAPRYVLMVSRANMPSSCFNSGSYYRIAVVETDGRYPKMISERARGCVRIVETWENLWRGTTSRCAFGRAKIEAERLIAELGG